MKIIAPPVPLPVVTDPWPVQSAPALRLWLRHACATHHVERSLWPVIESLVSLNEQLEARVQRLEGN